MTEFQIEVLELLRGIRDHLVAESRSPVLRAATMTPHRERFIDSLAIAFRGNDLPFDSGEVLEASVVNYELGEAMAVCGVTDTAGVGALLRSIHKTQGHPRYRLVRDDRAWRLEPRCT